MRKISLTILATWASVFAVPGAAQTAGNNFDTDADKRISKEEFSAGINAASDRGTFETYDADRSGDIAREEFAAAEFRRYDADNDDQLGADEYDAVTKVYGSENSDAGFEDILTAITRDGHDPGCLGFQWA